MIVALGVNNVISSSRSFHSHSIRLVDSDHNIDCKIDGFGAMALKSEFVKKA